MNETRTQYTLKDVDEIAFQFQPPTNFTGNVQQAKIYSSVNKNHGKGKFKYT